MNPLALIAVTLAIFLGCLTFLGQRAQPYPDIQSTQRNLHARFSAVALSPLVADRLRSRDRVSREEFDKLRGD